MPRLIFLLVIKRFLFFFYGFVPRAVDASVPWVIRYRAPLASLLIWKKCSRKTSVIYMLTHSAR